MLKQLERIAKNEYLERRLAVLGIYKDHNICSAAINWMVEPREASWGGGSEM